MKTEKVLDFTEVGVLLKSVAALIHSRTSLSGSITSTICVVLLPLFNSVNMQTMTLCGLQTELFVEYYLWWFAIWKITTIMVVKLK